MPTVRAPAGAALLLLATCAAPLSPPPETALDVWYTGCVEVRVGPVCIPDADFTLWTDAADTTVTLDGRPVDVVEAPAPFGPGRHVKPALPADAHGVLEVRGRVLQGRKPVDGAWSLRLATAPSCDDVDAQASRLWEALGATCTPASVTAAIDDLPSGCRAPGLRQAVKRAMGGSADCFEAVTGAILDRAEGRVDGVVATPSDVARHRALLAHQRVERGDLTGARDAVDLPEPATGGHLNSAYFLAFARGVAWSELQDHRAALRAFERAAVLGARWKPNTHAMVAEKLGVHQLIVGRYAEAFALWEQLTPSEATEPCLAARIQNNRAWLLLQAVDVGVDPTAWTDQDTDPVPLLLDAQRRLAQCDAHDRDVRAANVEVNLALAELDRSPAAAASHLRAAQELVDPLEGKVALWALEARIRLSLADGALDAASDATAAMEQVARRTGSPEFTSRGARWRARILRERGELEAAEAAYRDAWEHRVAHSALVPLREGRDAFLRQWEDAAREHVTTLLALGRVRDAMSTLRRARTQVVYGIYWTALRDGLSADQRAAVDDAVEQYAAAARALAALEGPVPASVAEPHAAAMDALRRVQNDALDRALTPSSGDPRAAPRGPAPGELLLAYLETQDGWLGFSWDDAGVRVAELGAVDLAAEPDVLGPALLGPHRAAVRRASVVTVLPSGRLSAIALHALPLEPSGGPLIAERPVRYAVDLPPRPGTPPANGMAVIVPSYARGTGAHRPLPAAQAEGARVVAAADGLVHALVGIDVDRAAVIRELAWADVVHFAGHAVADRTPWDSALVLSRDDRLTVADVLALDRTPRRALLSACSTAAAEAGFTETLGLAQALVVRGTQAAVATREPVEDADAAAMAAALYDAGWTAEDPAEAFQSAVVAALERGDPTAASYALVVP